jgi:diguanylate cyclase (GGDEF)-like protein
MQQQFGSDSDTVVTTLSQFTQLAIADGASDLKTADTFQMVAFGLLAAMMILVIGVVLYHARRMTHDVLRPLETLQEATQKLSQGDLDHRVEVPARCQRTEVGQLASAFNAMAGVLAENHQSLTLLASRDPLTGLANRLEFQVRLDRRIASNHRRTDDGDIVSVLFIDVDDFKDVNDSLGHAAGDALLAEVANRLSSCLRGRDLVARLGGDEFAILLTDRLADGSSAHGVAQRVIAAFDAPFAIAGTEIRVTVSIGVSIASPECDDPEDLLAQADYAMYTSKREGKGRHTVFDDVS